MAVAWRPKPLSSGEARLPPGRLAARRTASASPGATEGTLGRTSHPALRARPCAGSGCGCPVPPGAASCRLGHRGYEAVVEQVISQPISMVSGLIGIGMVGAYVRRRRGGLNGDVGGRGGRGRPLNACAPSILTYVIPMPQHIVSIWLLNICPATIYRGPDICQEARGLCARRAGRPRAGARRYRQTWKSSRRMRSSPWPSKSSLTLSSTSPSRLGPPRPQPTRHSMAWNSTRRHWPFLSPPM